MLVAGDVPTLRPWLLAVWLKNHPDAAARFRDLGPLLRGSLKLPRVFAADVDECSYWLPLAALHDPIAEAQYLTFIFDRGNPGPQQQCGFAIWLPIAWNGDQFLEHYEHATRADQEFMVEALLDSTLPLDSSYARALERIGSDVLRFDAPDASNAAKLLERVLELPLPARKQLIDKLFQHAPLNPSLRRSLARIQTLSLE